MPNLTDNIREDKDVTLIKLIDSILLDDAKYLSDWEIAFLESNLEKVKRGYSISEKVRGIIDRINERDDKETLKEYDDFYGGMF